MEEKKPAAPQKKKPNFLIRLTVFLLVSAVAVLAVCAVVFRDRLNIDNLRRWIQYRTLLRSDTGQAESFLYDGGLDNAFAILDGDMLVCSGNSISIYSASGIKYLNETVSMEHPVVNTNGDRAVAYDAGGSCLYVVGDRSLLWSSDDLPSIYSARLNKNGYLTVVTTASGYRCAITVYDGNFNPVMTVNLSSTLAMDAALSDDGRTLGILTVGQQGGSFSSMLSFYTMNYTAGSYTPDMECSLGSEVIVDIRHSSGIMWTLGDLGLTQTDHTGASSTVSWKNMYLRRYDMGGDNFVAAVLGRYKSGGTTELWLVSDSGQTTAMSYEEQILSISAAGRYIAVLTGDRLDIYTSDLNLYSTLRGTDGARKVLMMKNGSAVLISTTNAWFYVPA